MSNELHITYLERTPGLCRPFAAIAIVLAIHTTLHGWQSY